MTIRLNDPMPQNQTPLCQPLPASGRIEVRALRGPRAAEAELLIFGDIGSWDARSVSAQDVVAQLAAVDADVIRVRINSGGGSVTDGIAIYNALREHPATIRVTIEGIAASIASLIAMAGDRVEMADNALMMIHAPWSPSASGNAAELAELAEFLGRIEVVMAGAYARKSGKSQAEILALLRDYQDHWFTADEAVAAGFADAATVGTQAGLQAPWLARFAPRMPAAIAAALDLSKITVRMGQNGDFAMSTPHTAPEGSNGARRNEGTPNPNANDHARDEVLAAERDRISSIRAMAAPHMSNPEVANEFPDWLADGRSVADVGKRILAILAIGREPLGGGWGYDARAYGGNRNGGAEFVNAASDVLAMRGGVRIEKPSPGAREIAGMSIGAIAEACLSRDDRERGLSASSAIRAAMSTSDFPAILENTIRKAMRRGYEVEPGTHHEWIRRSTVPDFKPQSRVILGSMPELLPVAEGGEYQFGAMDEDKSVPFKVDKYGRIVSITWEALVNDDLAALSRIPLGLGQSARRKEADLVYELFDGSGQVMQDGIALFDSAHANLATAASALDDAALAAGRLLLRKQKALGGGELNLQPRVLLVPAELESQAERIIAASSVHVATSVSGTSGLEVMTPAWIKGLKLVVESRLPATAAYLLASPDQIDTAELAYLSGDNHEGGDDQGGPVVEEEQEFVRDVRRYKVRSVMGARFLDWRGIVKLPLSA